MSILSLGDNIKKIREQKNISQYALAKILSISQQSVAQWEKGITNPRRTMIDKLSNALNVTPNELFGYDDKLLDEDNQSKINNEISPEDLELLQKIKKLPPEKKKAIEILVSDDKQSMVVNK